MFIPSAKSNLSLISLLVIAIILFVWVNESRMFVKENYYQEKMAAATLMQTAIDSIKAYRLGQGIYLDQLNDPNQTSLIGERQSLITTDRGDLTAKLTSLNPNLAAAMVNMLKHAHLKKGDVIAMSCTGSYPAVNIAVMSAALVMELDMVIITSVGASMFGANDPDFTWLDYESFLNEKEIFPYKSVAASIGGGRDLGRGLNKIGRDLILAAIERNGIHLIQENTLEENIDRKMVIFEQEAGKDISLYVNVGGGLSSLGNSINGRLVSPGYHRRINFKNIPLKGTMFLFAEKGIPIIHLLDIRGFAEKYEFPTAPDPIPQPGEGSMYLDERYNITITVIALVILLCLLLVVILFDNHQMKLKAGDLNR